jgi:serine/threonine protein kinase
MEYVHGKDLRAVLKKLRKNRVIMPLGEALYIVREVAQALHHAYWSVDMTGQRLSVVHRDVSPHNIILSYDGAVKLLDFGVAVSAVTEQAETMIVGKWLYMSPETTMNNQVDHRSDLFSLGVILYLLCSGYMPFTGSEPKEIVRKIRAGMYKPLQEIVAIPEQLAYLVARLLSPHPDDRPQAGQEVATALTEISRQYRIESSGPSIANILKQLFPEEHALVAEQAGIPVNEVARVVVDEPDPLKPKEKSPVSVTPSTQSPSSKRLAPVDVSQTYRGRTGEIPPLSDGKPSSDEMPPLSRPVVWRPDPPTIRQPHQQVPEKVPNVRDWSVVQLAILLALLVLLAILIIRT